MLRYTGRTRTLWFAFYLCNPQVSNTYPGNERAHTRQEWKVWIIRLREIAPAVSWRMLA